MKSGEFQNLGLYLKEKRLGAGLTQTELSQSLKVHVQFVSNWERGLCAPPSHCFHHLIDVLALSRDQVVVAMVSDSKRSIEAKVFKKKKKAKAG
ncbi:hypothetical protein CIK05_14315 [Bdellovibrio sp. qaytius]|nr:hypothetical protein CIK05_14315 [Bdellovibrio sp. qaytius]